MTVDSSGRYCFGGAKCTDPAHLCQVVRRDFDSEKVKNLVRDGVYYCKHCGRVARREFYLCRPRRLDT